MKIYVAGPMRGIPEFNFPAFNAAAAALRAQGHIVFNPAENDVNRFGAAAYAPGQNPTGDEAAHAQRLGMDETQLRRQLFGDDMIFICREADGIALLPGWQNSKGAKAEHATAVALGLVVMELPA